MINLLALRYRNLAILILPTVLPLLNTNRLFHSNKCTRCMLLFWFGVRLFNHQTGVWGWVGLSAGTGQIEVHPRYPQRDLRQLCECTGVAVVAYASFGCGTLLRDPSVGAIAAQYGKSAAQVGDTVGGDAVALDCICNCTYSCRCSCGRIAGTVAVQLQMHCT